MTFTVFSKPACPFCDQAKTLLTTRGEQFNVVNIDVGQPKVEGEIYWTRDQLLAEFPGTRTLPLVLKGSEKIGGFTDLKNYLNVFNAVT